MKVFEFLLMPLSRLGIHPPNSVQDHYNRFRRAMILLTLIQFALAGIAFLLLEAGNFREYADSFYIFATSSLKVCTFTTTIYKRANIFKLIGEYQKTVDDRLKYPKSEALYNEVHKKIEQRSWLTYFSFIKVTLPGVVCPNYILSLVLYFITGLGRNSFSLAFSMWYPFDWRELFGCTAAFIHQFVSFFFLLHCCTVVVSFLVGSCGILMAFTEDMKSDLYLLNHKKTAREKIQILSNFINFHSKTQQLVYDFVDYFAVVITAYYLWSICTICSTLLVVQMELEHKTGHILEMVKPVILMFWSFVQIFMFCDFGQNVSAGFEELNDAIFEADWYTFPLRIQRMYPTIMMAMEKPMTLYGFGNIPCTREAFKKAINGGFSYYMVLRTTKSK